jgi:hypothetical protein
MLEVKGRLFARRKLCILMLRVEEKGEHHQQRKTIFVRKRIPSRFAYQNFLYGIQYQGPRIPIRWTIIHQTNLLIHQLSCRAKCSQNQSDVSSSVDFRDNCPSALHKMPVYLSSKSRLMGHQDVRPSSLRGICSYLTQWLQ